MRNRKNTAAPNLNATRQAPWIATLHDHPNLIKPTVIMSVRRSRATKQLTLLRRFYGNVTMTKAPGGATKVVAW